MATFFNFDGGASDLGPSTLNSIVPILLVAASEIEHESIGAVHGHFGRFWSWFLYSFVRFQSSRFGGAMLLYY
jgi:hypothetical protein